VTVGERRLTQYAEITRQATIHEAGGLPRERSVLLLWFLRNVLGVGDIEAYDLICDDDDDHGIDALFVEPSAGDDLSETLVIFQSKHVESPNTMLGATDVDRLAGAAGHFVSEESVRRLLSGRVTPRLRDLIGEYELVAKLRRDPAAIRVRLVLVTSGLLHAGAKRQVENLRETHGCGYVDVWTIDRLGPLAMAVRAPERMRQAIEVPCTSAQIVITGSAPNRVAILSVRAIDIAGWSGIDDRSLFALNVRHELAPNKVSRGLDRAIVDQSDHRDFLAYHNGLTLVCDGFEKKRGKLRIRRPSVANGAQSVMAFARGAGDGQLTDDLRVFVKVVEVAGRPSLEKEVSRRSNTQTRVSPRNLMANSGPQLRLQRAFEREYPDIVYVTRPDTQVPENARALRNDDAAQLLTAVYNEWPWLAVKRESLFEPDNHPHIFSEAISPAHVLLAEKMGHAVDEEKERFPEEYRRSWRLVRLVGVYLVGQIAREAAGEGQSIVDVPREAVLSASIATELKGFARVAAAVLERRHRDLGEEDDYRKDLKNQPKLVALGNAAREAYDLAQALSGSE